MPLRIRIVLVLVALVALALAVIEPVTYISTRQSLVAKVDSQLSSSEHPVLQFLVTHEQPFAAIVPGTYAALYGNGRSPVFVHQPGTSARPILPKNLLDALSNSPTGVLHGTVAGTSGVESYRVLGMRVQLNSPFGGPPGNYLFFVAIPLTGVESTLAHVLLLEVLVGLLVLLALAAGSWFLVQLSLRPLEQMAKTASEIAAGDLTARIDDTDERTEVGRLGAALNTMLSKIEQAFHQKEASEEQLRRFVADASHELRTPLTSIRGYAELFRKGLADRPDDLAAALRRIESESARMGGLVEDLLLLARLDQGRQLTRAGVNLTELAADAVGDALVVDPSRAIRLVAAGRCVIEGDEAALRQVLGNLLSNALAYTPDGSPIEVNVHMDKGASNGVGPGSATGAGSRRAVPGGPEDRLAGSGPAPVARIAVVDHGPGIPSDDAAHIFDRFWRADLSRVRASGGTGLGLSIVAAIVGAHGGRVAVAGTPGGGSTFVVELPLGTAGHTETAAAVAGPSLSSAERATDVELPAGSAEVRPREEVQR